MSFAVRRPSVRCRLPWTRGWLQAFRPGPHPEGPESVRPARRRWRRRSGPPWQRARPGASVPWPAARPAHRPRRLCRVVCAATKPARWAAMPATAMTMEKPFERALSANSIARLGVRCALMMCASKGIASCFSTPMAFCTTGRSLSLPINIATRPPIPQASINIFTGPTKKAPAQNRRCPYSFITVACCTTKETVSGLAIRQHMPGIAIPPHRFIFQY